MSASPPSAPEDLAPFLSPNRYVDSDDPRVVAFAHAHAGDDPDPVARAVSLYYAIRDGWRYNPWNVHFDKAAYAASAILERDRDLGAHCIDKALVLAATCRVFGIPSRLHFANVRNHIGTARLEQRLGTDLLVFHGYTELFLNVSTVKRTVPPKCAEERAHFPGVPERVETFDGSDSVGSSLACEGGQAENGRWVAATPAFNKALCEKLGVAPLEFDGQTDSIFQEYDAEQRRFMEYATDHGTHAGVPFDAMVAAWKHHYRPLAENGRWPDPT